MVLGEADDDGLAAMPPGPALAAALAGLTLLEVPNDDIIDVLVARSRQLAHDQALMFESINEVLHRLPFAAPGEIRRGPGPGRFSADEVRAALAWTRRFADGETDLAHALVVVLPAVWQALLAGEIDRGKAVVFADHLVDLTPELIDAICAVVLPVAGGLTPWQIGERIKRMIRDLDPAYFERRYRKAIDDRKVVGYLDEHGAAVITGSGLPAADAAAALERVDSLARATRRAGHPNTLDQLRADIFLGLLDGSLHGQSRAGIIATLLNAARAGSDVCLPPSRVAHPTATPQPSTDPTPTDPTPGPGPVPAAGPGPAPAAAPAAAAASPAAGPGPAATAAAAVPDPVGIEIRVPLTTLLGLDQRGGEIPAWGPVTADVARATVARQRRAEWRWVVLDDNGHLLTEGITRRRPTGQARTAVRGGIVELQIPADRLAELAGDAFACGPWARVVADIAEQHATRDAEQHAHDLDAHPDERFPRAALRRHVQVRDRHCLFRGCRTPARRSDQDHTHDHALGGTTTADDLGPTCRHDHTLKTDGDWQLDQTAPGVFIWTSPLGRRYPVTPEPILPPAPEPITREPDPDHDLPADPTERPMTFRPRRRAPPLPPAPTRHRARLDWTSPPEPDDPTPF